MPDAAYAWRPQPGVRSAGEVFQHIASDNYFLPAMLDKQAPTETGITKDYKTAEAFEKRPMNKAGHRRRAREVVRVSRRSMDATTDAQLDTAIDMFGQKSTTQGALDFHGDALARAPRSADCVRAVEQGHATVEQVAVSQHVPSSLCHGREPRWTLQAKNTAGDVSAVRRCCGSRAGILRTMAEPRALRESGKLAGPSRPEPASGR